MMFNMNQYREAGCNPLSTGLLSDWFSEEKRGLVMSIFNWGIYGGYGIAFPVGRYVPELNAWGLVNYIKYFYRNHAKLPYSILLTIFVISRAGEYATTALV